MHRMKMIATENIDKKRKSNVTTAHPTATELRGIVIKIT